MVQFLASSAEEAAQRSAIYRLLARLWLREVDDDFARQLCSNPLCDRFVESGGVLLPSDDEAAIDQLAVDYCQLFIGPATHLPPFQSVWQDGRFHGTPTDSMRQYIDVIRYDADKLPSGMMLDHLGVQLDVMGHILDQVSNWPSHKDSLSTVWDLAHSFFGAHLQWPTDLLKIAEERASTKFYRAAIVLTRDFLASEILV